VLLCIVNPFSNPLNEFLQLEQKGRVQNRRWFKHVGVRAGWSLIGPLPRKSDRADVFIEKREDFATSTFPDLEDEKPFSRQRMKRVSYSGPSQILVGTECSLLGVSRRSWIDGFNRGCCKSCSRSSIRPSASTVMDSALGAAPTMR